MFKISVIICTHNPRIEYLDQTLASLKRQTLSRTQWELIIVDNGSKIPLKSVVDVSWHSDIKIVCEDRIGLTYARLRGIIEGQGEIFVFVDDDNVLVENYLLLAAEICRANPCLGVIGAGNINPIFEVDPGALLPWTSMLALRNSGVANWSNIPFDDSDPYGAGMVVRRQIAEAYVLAAQTNERRLKLGRSGQSLLSGEDLDIAFMACRLGLGKGIFPELRLDHLIPTSRLHQDYMIRLAEGHAFSEYILREEYQDISKKTQRPTIKSLSFWIKWILLGSVLEKRFKLATHRGRNKAKRYIQMAA